MIKTKLVTFKPNKTGEVTIYLDKGVNKHDLVDLEGQEVIIKKAEPEDISEPSEDIKPLLSMILNYAQKRYEQGRADELKKWQEGKSYDKS